MKFFIPLFATNRFSLCFLFLTAVGMVPVSLAGTVSGDYTVNSVQLSETPAASAYDLAQTHYAGSSATGGNQAPSEHAQLFNGLVGNDDGDANDSGEVTMDSGNTVTIHFDLSDHADGYDIRGIHTYFGWKTDGGGRANQGYSIQFTFVDNSTATIGAQHWETNSPASYWTLVSFEAGASGPIVSGVKAVTFDISEDANVGGVVVGREFDIFGSPTGLEYALTLQAPNGWRIPKVLGASGNIVTETGYDYLDWFGTTEHRYWFKPSFSTYADDSGITSAAAFDAASEAIRQDPMRQATTTDYFIDWNHFNGELIGDGVPEDVNHLLDRGIMPMVINSSFISPEAPITDDWVNTFSYWKYWYTMVYHFAAEYGVTMYEFRNEPHHHGAPYDVWESHWLVCADAMRKAMDDVNRDFGTSLEVNICGPVCAGAYWDYSYPDPYDDPHGWGSVSWEKIKVDIYGNYDVNNPWNYGSYDYHRYGQDAERTEEILKDTRSGIANAQNDPNSTIPIVITEYNTSTGGNFDRREIDTEDLRFGVSMAPLLHASAVYGPDGLGDDGGIFIFKLGADQSAFDLVGVGNKLSYCGGNAPGNFGGVTRGGACFQMYARHFSGGKPLLPVVVNSGVSADRRTMAAIDQAKGMIYIYGANVNASGDPGADVPVSIDLSALDVEAGAVASLQRVDAYNTGQITELLTVDGSKRLSFYCPSYTAFLIKVPMRETVPYQWEIVPSDDTTETVVSAANQGTADTMSISMHHTNAVQRQVGLLRFEVEGAGSIGQALLKLSGRNTGVNPLAREIVHVYAVTDADWSENADMEWDELPGLGQYVIDAGTMGATDGTGDMVDIEDNYAGFTSGPGTGLGLTGQFLGAVSFHASQFEENYLEVTDYLNSVTGDGSGSVDVTFVVVRIVRYNVNQYSNSYYTQGEYHYDGRVVEIATKEHADEDLQPRLICSAGLPPVVEAEAFSDSNGVSVQTCSDVGGGSMVEFYAAGDSVSYDVRVSEAGTYLVAFRVASDSGLVNLELAQDGTPITTINRVVDGGEWTTVYKMVTLQPGFTTFTVTATDVGTQWLNWFELSASSGEFEESVPETQENIAESQPASASSVHSSSYGPEKAFDGDYNTRWASTEGTPWLEVDLGADTYVNGVSMVDYGNRIRSYEMQVFENGSWKTAIAGGNPVDGQIESFPAVLGSLFRLQVLTSSGNPSVYELELYGLPGLSTTMEMNADSMLLEWSNVPGATYAVQYSTNLVMDPFSATVESGIPALTETNSIMIELSEEPAAFYRIITE